MSVEEIDALLDYEDAHTVDASDQVRYKPVTRQAKDTPSKSSGSESSSVSQKDLVSHTCSLFSQKKRKKRKKKKKPREESNSRPKEQKIERGTQDVEDAEFQDEIGSRANSVRQGRFGQGVAQTQDRRGR